MQTNNYEEARTFFMNHSQHGWKHIESFIVSEDMLERLLKDNLPIGSVIQLEPNNVDPRTLPRTNIRIKGYPIIVSKGYTLPYGVTYIQYKDEFDEEVLGLLGKSVSIKIAL